MCELPKTVFHYCSVNNFYNIIKNHTLRLSDINCTNDYAERKWISGVIRDYSLSNILPQFNFNKLNLDIENIFNNIIDEICLESVYMGYISCMSENGDLLSQWRGYADNGVGLCIGFNTGFLRDFANLHKFMKFMKVNYDLEDLKTNIIKQVDEWTDVFIKNEGNIFTNKNKLYVFFEALVCMSFWSNGTFNKSAFFKEEQEWRISIEDYSLNIADNPSNYNLTAIKNMGNRKNDFFSLSNLGSYSSDDKISTYFDLNFMRIKSNLISKIVIGPKSKLEIKDIRCLLIAEDYDLKNIEVVHSNGTYR